MFLISNKHFRTKFQFYAPLFPNVLSFHTPNHLMIVYLNHYKHIMILVENSHLVKKPQ